MSSSFQKSLKNIDKKLQGRVLEALLKICESPVTAQGNTIKPLTGELSGLWRYRIGGHRLVYRPDIESRKVLFIEFSPRGSVYE
ncbi:MAG: type II toxin-antitoxin system RelE/ParE family toxin [Candidatus Thiodiazotropha endolucinida]